MTINSVIESIDRLKPNGYTDADKYGWISAVDGILSVEVLGESQPVSYRCPEDGDKELILPAPFDDLYGLYLGAMIDFYNQEYTHYNNSAMLFAQRLDEYKRWYLRQHGEGKAKNFRNVMG